MSQQIRCIILDDEPIARKILINYSSYLPILDIVAVCGNSFEAREMLTREKIDLIFLDINMPVLDGIDFLNTLKNPPQVIFTTAYKHHAITAFDLAACDYLVKPFALERFIQAVDKAVVHLSFNKTPILSNNEYILIKAANKIYNIKKDDLFYAEAKGNYTSIFLSQNMLMPKMALSSLEKLLPIGQFIRAHRSFIINRIKINHIEGNRIFIDKYEIPIGHNYKDRLMELLNPKG